MQIRSRAAGWSCPDCGSHYPFGRARMAAGEAFHTGVPFAYCCPKCGFEVEFWKRPEPRGWPRVWQNLTYFALIVLMGGAIFVPMPLIWALRGILPPGAQGIAEFALLAMGVALVFGLIALGEGVKWRWQTRFADSTGEWTRHLVHDPEEGEPAVALSRARPRRQRAKA